MWPISESWGTQFKNQRLGLGQVWNNLIGKIKISAKIENFDWNASFKKMC